MSNVPLPSHAENEAITPTKQGFRDENSIRQLMPVRESSLNFGGLELAFN